MVIVKMMMLQRLFHMPVRRKFLFHTDVLYQPAFVSFFFLCNLLKCRDIFIFRSLTAECINYNKGHQNRDGESVTEYKHTQHTIILLFSWNLVRDHPGEQVPER